MECVEPSTAWRLAASPGCMPMRAVVAGGLSGSPDGVRPGRLTAALHRPS